MTWLVWGIAVVGASWAIGRRTTSRAPEERKPTERTRLSPCERFDHAIPNRHGERRCGRCWRHEDEITRERSDR